MATFTTQAEIEAELRIRLAAAHSPGPWTGAHATTLATELANLTSHQLLTDGKITRLVRPGALDDMSFPVESVWPTMTDAEMDTKVTATKLLAATDPLRIAVQSALAAVA